MPLVLVIMGCVLVITYVPWLSLVRKQIDAKGRSDHGQVHHHHLAAVNRVDPERTATGDLRIACTNSMCERTQTAVRRR